MSRYEDKFVEIMGDITGVDIKTITIDDIRKKAGDTYTEADIKVAIKGLKVLQANEDKCEHANLRCTCCGEEGTAGHFIGSRRRVLSEETKQLRREVGKLGGRPRKIKPVEA